MLQLQYLDQQTHDSGHYPESLHMQHMTAVQNYHFF